MKGSGRCAFALAVLFLAASMSAQQSSDKPKLRRSEIYGFHGPVHTQLSIPKKLAPDPRGEKRKLLIREPQGWLEFDEAGEIVADGQVDESGQPLAIVRRPQNPQGNELETVITDHHATTHILAKHKETAAGSSESETFVEGKLLGRTESAVHAGKNESETRSFDDKGQMTSHSIFRNAPQRKETLVWGRNGEFVLHDDRRYDEMGNLIESLRHDAEGKIVSDMVFKDGELISWWQDPACNCANVAGFNLSAGRSVTYATSKDGHLRKNISNHHGRSTNLELDDEELYDENDHLLERIAYTYERDEHGNWMRRVTSVLDVKTGDMTPVREDNRKLTYY